MKMHVSVMILCILLFLCFEKINVTYCTLIGKGLQHKSFLYSHKLHHNDHPPNDVDLTSSRNSVETQIKKCKQKMIESLNMNPNYKFIKIYGMFNSGTNYAFDLFESNGFEVGQNNTINCSLQGKRDCAEKYMGWKHGDPNTFGHKFFPLNLTTTMPVIMIRNPLSWIDSMMHAPYNMKNCIKMQFNPCEYEWGSQSCLGYINLKCKYSNSILSWGEYYSRMLSKITMTEGFYIRYEDLVLQPEKILTQLRIRANLKGVGCSGNCISGKWNSVLHESRIWVRKKSKKNNSNETAKQKIVRKPYLKNIVPKVLKTMCTDKNTVILMKKFYYIDDCKDFVMNTTIYEQSDLMT